MANFNPKDHVINLERNTSKPKRHYLEVKWRLMWMNDEHPIPPNSQISISTDAVLLTENMAVVKATVSIVNDDFRVTRTGYSRCTETQFQDFLEKAETAAIGRALLAVGYGTQWALEYDEGLTSPRPKLADSPIDETEIANDMEKSSLSALDKLRDFRQVFTEAAKIKATEIVNDMEKSSLSESDLDKLRDLRQVFTEAAKIKATEIVNDMEKSSLFESDLDKLRELRQKCYQRVVSIAAPYILEDGAYEYVVYALRDSGIEDMSIKQLEDWLKYMSYDAGANEVALQIKHFRETNEEPSNDWLEMCAKKAQSLGYDEDSHKNVFKKKYNVSLTEADDTTLTAWYNLMEVFGDQCFSSTASTSTDALKKKIAMTLGQKYKGKHAISSLQAHFGADIKSVSSLPDDPDKLNKYLSYLETKSPDGGAE